MARITVEDCIDKFPSRFELVLIASNRARKLHSGETPTVEKDNDKNTVIALREIAQETITVDQLKNNLVEEYQTTTISDEEELNEISDESSNLDENLLQDINDVNDLTENDNNTDKNKLSNIENSEDDESHNIEEDESKNELNNDNLKDVDN